MQTSATVCCEPPCLYVGSSCLTLPGWKKSKNAQGMNFVGLALRSISLLFLLNFQKEKKMLFAMTWFFVVSLCSVYILQTHIEN